MTKKFENIADVMIKIILTIVFVVGVVGAISGLGMIGQACVGYASFVEEMPVAFWAIWIVCLLCSIGLGALEVHTENEDLIDLQFKVASVIAGIIGIGSLIIMFLIEQCGIILISEDFTKSLLTYVLAPMLFNIIIAIAILLREA